jgi:hypothetical protein
MSNPTPLSVHIAKFKSVHGESHYNYDECVYTHSQAKIKIWCNVHQEYFYIRIHDHIRGSGCRKCAFIENSKKFTKSYESFEKEAREFHGDDYQYFQDEYINRTTPMRMKCLGCGLEFKCRPDTHILGRKCICKTESKGERRIRNYLNKCNVDFVTQYRNEDCKHVKTLPFDFAIFKYGKLIGLFEYQGRQHFDIVNFGKRTEEELIQQLEITKLRDKIKRDWCDKNNIPIFTFRYDRKKLLMWVKVAINMCFQKEDIHEKIEK